MRTERISLADIASRFAELRQLWRTSSRRGNLTSDEEYQIIGTDDPEKGPCIQYQKEIVFKHIVISATRPLAKVMGFHPATTLHIFLGSSATRAEARSDFLEYLHERGLPEDFTSIVVFYSTMPLLSMRMGIFVTNISVTRKADVQPGTPILAHQ